MRNNKLLKLKKLLTGMKRVVIAFSGGLDSVFLLKAAIDTLGRKNVLAVTAKSATYPEREYMNALKTGRELRAKHLTIYTGEAKNKTFMKNPVNRCYYCKKELFGRMKSIAAKKDFRYILDGFNADDKKDLRFGSIAAREMGVRSPLAEAGMLKKDIRIFSKRLGLSTWDKPSLACLASRIPYGRAITSGDLKKIDAAEAFLERCGFRQVRVRAHGNIARIEIPAGDIKKFLTKKMPKKASAKLRGLGFSYITLDLEGYRTGSMNEVLT